MDGATVVAFNRYHTLFLHVRAMRTSLTVEYCNPFSFEFLGGGGGDEGSRNMPRGDGGKTSFPFTLCGSIE